MNPGPAPPDNDELEGRRSF